MFSTIRTNTEILIEGFNAIYYFEADKYYSHPIEQHDFWEMVYVDCGKINALSKDTGYVLSQGQVIFHAPMELHAHISDGHTVNNTMVIGFTSHSEALSFLAGKIFNLDSTAKSLLGLLFRELPGTMMYGSTADTDLPDPYFQDTAFGSSQLIQCYFTEFLIHLIRTADTEKISPNEESRSLMLNAMSDPIAEYIQQNIYSNLTLDDICSHFFISRTQLGKIFKAKLGKSTIEYYTELKINEAKKLLRTKEYTVTQIAEMLHFSSVHTFSRTFKNITGFSPSEYAQRISI